MGQAIHRFGCVPRSSERCYDRGMESILLASLGSKGQVTLPKQVRRLLRIGKARDLVGFKVTPSGIALIPVEVREKPLRFSAAEWKKIDRLRRRKGKVFRSARELRSYLDSL